jgi:hypothetical protein
MIAARPFGDQRLPDRFQLLRPEIRGQCATVELLERSRGPFHVGVLTAAGFTVVAGSVGQIVGDEFHDGEFVFCCTEQTGASGREPFGDEPVVFQLARFGAMWSDVVVATRDRDDSLPACAVLAILRDGIDESWQARNLPGCQNGMYRFASQGNTALPNAGRYQKS